MSILLSPFYSEFESEEEAESYDRWFRAKVQAALDDPGPGIPHDEAMILLDQMIRENRRKRSIAESMTQKKGGQTAAQTYYTRVV